MHLSLKKQNYLVFSFSSTSSNLALASIANEIMYEFLNR
jgi:hypothetical protein